MKIDISELKQQVGDSISFAGEENLVSLIFMGEDISFIHPPVIEGKVTHTDVGFLVSGKVEATIQRQCGRCMELYTEKIESRFDQVFRQHYSALEMREKSQDDETGTEAEDYVIEFKGDLIDLKDVIMESVIIAIPMKTLCKEECQGLCVVCGLNLNEDSCTCEEERIDERLAGLKQLLNKD